MDLVNKLWNFCHTLRHEGVDYNDYIEELTYLLFIKIAEERGIKIPEGCNWKALVSCDTEKLLITYNNILTALSEQKNIIGDIFKQPIARIRSATALKKLLNLIGEISWSEYDEDILGSMFEGLLEKAATESKKGAGQYFTPRPLINAIIRVMKPNPFESPTFTISDVACGTAGFIISSFEWWRRINSLTKLNTNQKKKLFEKTYYGQELVLRPRRLAQVNLFLHGITPNIKLGDTIDTIYNSEFDGQHECVLTNPPFGNKGADQIPNRPDFKIKTSNKQLNFIQHVYSCLKHKGRAAIVLPDNVLTEEKAIELWKYLLPLCNLHTILKLPNGTFLPYANVKAIVIFLQKGIPTKKTWIFDARTNIESINKSGRPLSEDHFNEFISCFGTDPNAQKREKDHVKNARFRSFSIYQIEGRGYNLDINWRLGKQGIINNSKSSPNEALELAIQNMEGMIKNLKKILTTIDN